MEYIVIPKGIKSVSAGVFNGCTGLKKIFTYPSETDPEAASWTYNFTASKPTIYLYSETEPASGAA